MIFGQTNSVTDKTTKSPNMINDSSNFSAISEEEPI